MIGAAVWVGMHVQVGRHGVGYVGTQAAFVFVVTLVQGPAPPSSIMAGVDRFAGIIGGLGVLLVVSLLLWPTDAEQAVRPPLVSGDEPHTRPAARRPTASCARSCRPSWR